jgi:hypothetical protein
MRALSAAELLHVWEHGAGQPPVQRGLMLFVLAAEETPVEQLARMPVGQRDAHLLALRRETFGSQLVSLATCPGCSSQVEFQVEADDLLARAIPERPAELGLAEGDYQVEFRLPTSFDLGTLDPAADVEKNRRRLLERCVTRASRSGQEVAVAELPEEVRAAIARRMAEADPQADVQLALACPECRHDWQTQFDIVSYFWAEIHAWARQMLRDIHTIASAYGWGEAEVLALTPTRRQAYLELIGS